MKAHGQRELYVRRGNPVHLALLRRPARLRGWRRLNDRDHQRQTSRSKCKPGHHTHSSTLHQVSALVSATLAAWATLSSDARAADRTPQAFPDSARSRRPRRARLVLDLLPAARHRLRRHHSFGADARTVLAACAHGDSRVGNRSRRDVLDRPEAGRAWIDASHQPVAAAASPGPCDNECRGQRRLPSP